MHQFIRSLLTTISLTISVNSFCQLTFENIDSIYKYAEKNSVTILSGNISAAQAKQGKLAALLSIPEISGGASFNFTNNVKLPVSLFPAEAFGGQPGTFREIQTGIQYNSYFGQNLDVKIMNLPAWKNLKLAKVNLDITNTGNLLTKKALFENINTTYYTIIQLQEQLKLAIQNTGMADTLLKITTSKYNQQIIRLSDLNESKVNLLSKKESEEQYRLLVKYYYQALSILLDVPSDTTITLTETIKDFSSKNKPTATDNTLNYQNAIAKEQYALSTYHQSKLNFWPSLSFFGNNNYNLFNQNFKLLDGRWINSQQIGFRLNINIPSSQLISNRTKAKYDYLLAQKNTSQIANKASIESIQLNIDYEKAYSQYITNKEIALLREESYKKNLELYKEGLLGLDQTLSSFTNLISSKDNLIISAATVMLTTSKIILNNTIK